MDVWIETILFMIALSGPGEPGVAWEQTHALIGVSRARPANGLSRLELFHIDPKNRQIFYKNR